MMSAEERGLGGRGYETVAEFLSLFFSPPGLMSADATSRLQSSVHTRMVMRCGGSTRV